MDTPEDIEHTADFELLHHYCETGDLGNVADILDQGIDVNGQDCFQNTALFYAASVGQAAVVQLLLRCGAHMDAKNHDHYTAVQRASEEGHYEVVRILMDAGADIQSRDLKWGATPLLCATYWGYRSIVQLLCENKARVTGLSTHFGYTSLHLAGMKGHVDILSDLLEFGADVNARAQNGVTPLLMSLGSKKVTLVKNLLDYGASVDLQDNRGEFALYCAAQIGWCEGVGLLLSYGSDVYKQTKQGETALHAACYGNHSGVVNLLASNYPKLINHQGNQGNTPLHIAAMMGSELMVETLLCYGADITTKNSSNMTAHEIAGAKGHSGIAIVLQEHGNTPQTHGIVEITQDVSDDSDTGAFVHTKPNVSDQRILDEAMNILRKQCPHISGLQKVCLAKGTLVRPRHPLFVQILKFNARFVLVSTLNLPIGHIEVFDPGSTRSTLSSSNIRTISNLMFTNDNPEFHIYHVKVQHSFNVSESALVCLAVLTCILFEDKCPSPNDLSHTAYIGEHIKYCLKNGEFSFWHRNACKRKKPIRSVQNLASGNFGCRGNDHEVTKMITDLHCVCQIPCKKIVKRKCIQCHCFYQSVCMHHMEQKNNFLHHSELAFNCPDCDIAESLLKYPSRYDAFVSYSYNDFWFIKQHLLPQIESPPPPEPNFQLAIAHRDFMPGACIAETILESITQSRKCVAVISKNFFKGHWNDFEWEQMVVHRWKSMVLILLDPLDEIVSAEWMPTLNCYLKTRFFLQWKQDYTDEERQYFWKTLRNFLDPEF